MYTVIAIFITAALIVLTVLGAREASTEKRKRILFVNLGISAASAIAGVAVSFLVRAVIFRDTAAEEWQEWAWDAFTLFLKTTLPVMGTCLVLIILTTVVTAFGSRKPNLFSAVVRQSASAAVSVILLSIAPFYSAMAETDQAPIHAFILLFGICEALFMRLTFAVEMAIKLKMKK